MLADIHCSFCQTGEHDGRLFAGFSAFICTSCVAQFDLIRRAERTAAIIALRDAPRVRIFPDLGR